MLLVGGDRYELDREPPIAHNSLFALGRRRRGAARRYDKVDLVPFGEFLPFRRRARAISGLRKLTQGTIDFVPGPGRVTLQLPGPAAGEPADLLRGGFPAATPPTRRDRPAWLVNITNDAWFGRSSGPYQHLAMARMRAVEEGLPLVRAANTGISVVTDAYGRVRAQPGARTRPGVIDALLPAAAAAGLRSPAACAAGSRLALLLATLGA